MISIVGFGHLEFAQAPSADAPAAAAEKCPTCGK